VPVGVAVGIVGATAAPPDPESATEGEVAAAQRAGVWLADGAAKLIATTAAEGCTAAVYRPPGEVKAALAQDGGCQQQHGACGGQDDNQFYLHGHASCSRIAVSSAG